MTSPTTSAGTPLAWRLGAWGAWGLSLLAVAVLASAGEVLAWAPAVVLPVLALAGFVVYHSPKAGLALTILTAAALRGRGDGIQVGEVLYLGTALVFWAYWYGREWNARRPQIRTPSDLAWSVYLVGGLTVASAVGFVAGGTLSDIRAEVLALLSGLFYFPVRDVCRRESNGAVAVAGAMAILAGYAVVTNALDLRSAFQSASQAWEIADSRAIYGETLIALGLIGSLAVAASVTRWRWRLGMALLTALCVGGLLMTKSRGFWVATMVGVGCAALVAPSHVRRRVFLIGGVGFGTLLVSAFVVAPGYTVLLIEGVVRRFATLSSATTGDVSLINRFVEAKAAVDRAVLNPILGYGLGVPNRYPSLTPRGTASTPFIHNGYVSLWFKMGLWGLLSVGFVMASALWQGVVVAKARELTTAERAIGLGAFGTLVTYSITTVTSNPFPISDQALAFTVVIGVLAGLSQRLRTIRRESAHGGSEA